MNSEQIARLNRLINNTNGLWNTSVSKIIQVSDNLFIVFYKDNNHMIVKINKLGVMSVPDYKTVYHSELKPEVS